MYVTDVKYTWNDVFLFVDSISTRIRGFNEATQQRGAANSLRVRSAHTSRSSTSVTDISHTTSVFNAGS